MTTKPLTGRRVAAILRGAGIAVLETVTMRENETCSEMYNVDAANRAAHLLSEHGWDARVVSITGTAKHFVWVTA
jgi:hypothetical protein